MENKDGRINILKKLGGIGLIILSLQIPIIKFWDLLSERERNQSEAISQTVATSGPSQTIIGPVIQLPYLIKSNVEATPSNPSRGFLYIFPDKLKIDAKLKTEVRKRGIFEIPTYSADLDFSGTFSPLDVKVWDQEVLEFLWSEAKLSIGVSEPKTIRDQQAFKWNQNLLEFEPAAVAPGIIKNGIHVSLPGLSANPTEPQSFQAKLTIGGTQGLHFVPVGKSTEVDLVGDWSTPSFTGSFSPIKRDSGDNNFSANWRVSDLGGGFGVRQLEEISVKRNNECQHGSNNCNLERFGNYNFGVKLLNSVDTYRIVNRAVKYQLLIVVLTFTTFFMFELIYGLKLHPVQYFLVGLSLVLFYLLLLSLAEHLGFLLAYLLATCSVVALVGGYSLSVLNGKRRALTIIGAMSALYLYLFSALTSEDYALLTGSFGFTIVLGIVMYFTRNINWYELTEAKKVCLADGKTEVASN